MTLVEAIQLYGIEHLGRYYSPHRAYVVDNIDKNNTERLKVLIPSIADGVQCWAYPKGLSGTINTGFKYLTPMVGSVVWVEFERGDPTKPVWSYHGWAIEQQPEELRGTDVCGLVTPKGNKIYLKEEDGVLNIELNQGLELKVKDGTTISIEGEDTVLNGGKNGGLTITPKLVEELNKTRTLLQTIIGIINGPPIPEAGNSSPSSFKTALQSAIAGQSLGEFSQIENKKIKH